MSVEEFIDLLIKSNPRLEAIEAAVDIATADVTAAGLWENPSIAYDREEVFSSDRGGFGENFFRIDIPFEISNRRSLRVQAAEEGRKAVRADSDLARTELLLSGVKSYLHAATVRLKVKTLSKSRASLNGLLDSVRARVSAGDTSGYDLDRLEIEATTLNDLITVAEQDLNRIRGMLGLFLGKPAAEYDATDPLSLPAIAAAEPLPPAKGSLDSRPDYRSARYRISQSNLELEASHRGWVPTLTLSAGAKNARIDEETGWGYTAGLTASFPIFDFGQADKEKASAQLKRARANLRAIEQQVTTEVALARDTLTRTIKQALDFERDQLPRLEKLLRRAEISYREGESPVFELLDAYRTEREIRLRHLELLLKARLSEVDLWRALGQVPGGNS